MLTILQLVYGADEVLDQGTQAEVQPSSARDIRVTRRALATRL